MPRGKDGALNYMVEGGEIKPLLNLMCFCIKILYKTQQPLSETVKIKTKAHLQAITYSMTDSSGHKTRNLPLGQVQHAPLSSSLEKLSDVSIIQ